MGWNNNDVGWIGWPRRDKDDDDWGAWNKDGKTADDMTLDDMWEQPGKPTTSKPITAYSGQTIKPTKKAVYESYEEVIIIEDKKPAGPAGEPRGPKRGRGRGSSKPAEPARGPTQPARPPSQQKQRKLAAQELTKLTPTPKRQPKTLKGAKSKGSIVEGRK